ncbi:MAG: hypothetical protein U5N86_05815 [Planctomycetota bacterium]|nr:hypothetical protein [Planctomycetota bacterium]
MFGGKNLLILTLMVTCAFLLGLVVKGDSSSTVPFAHAEGAANGVIVTTGKVDDSRDRLYLVHTEKKVICVYDNFNGKFRLCGIHSYKYDTEFESSSNDKRIEDQKDGADFDYMRRKFLRE